jgi:predicted secreted hydrolase
MNRADRLAGLAMVVFTIFTVDAQAQSGWRKVTGPPELSFPRDHGGHFEYRTEWWYVTGLVDGEEGRRYGFQITFFRQGLAPGELEPGASNLRARQIVAAHLAVADISEQRFLQSERLRRIGGGLAGVSQTDLEVWLDDWRMERRGDDLIRLTARDPEQRIGLELELRPRRRLIAHGDRGYSQKGEDRGNASVYLSWTRFRVTGRLEVGGSPVTVEGMAWFDHEWGTSQIGAGVVGWDWFSLRLDDARDLMIYRLRQSDGGADARSSGTLVESDGRSSPLERDDVELDVLERWQSPATGAHYPTRWRLRIPSEGIDLELRALLEASELDGTATTGVIYWEGPVEAWGSQRGEGYVEMTGYAGTLEGRF